MAVSRKIQSSGYAKNEEPRKFFRPRINKKKMNSKVKSYLRAAWESNDGKNIINKTKEDFSPVTRPWYIRKKRLLKVLKNKAIYMFIFNFTHGI